MGDFTAYQLLMNLYYSSVLNFSQSDFVVAGPGAHSQAVRQGFGQNCTRIGDQRDEVASGHTERALHAAWSRLQQRMFHSSSATLSTHCGNSISLTTITGASPFSLVSLQPCLTLGNTQTLLLTPSNLPLDHTNYLQDPVEHKLKTREKPSRDFPNLSCDNLMGRLTVSDLVSGSCLVVQCYRNTAIHTLQADLRSVSSLTSPPLSHSPSVDIPVQRCPPWPCQSHEADIVFQHPRNPHVESLC